MKPRTFFGFALLIPYILWGVCALIFFLISSQEIPEAWSLALMPITFYTFGILLWFVPYTVLAVGMWIWGRNRSTTTLSKLALLAPILFFVFMLIEAWLISLPADSVMELAKSALQILLLLGGFSLVFGYLCVGIGLGVYKFLLSKNIIKEATTLNNEPSPSEA